MESGSQGMGYKQSVQTRQEGGVPLRSPEMLLRSKEQPVISDDRPQDLVARLVARLQKPFTWRWTAAACAVATFRMEMPPLLEDGLARIGE